MKNKNNKWLNIFTEANWIGWSLLAIVFVSTIAFGSVDKEKIDITFILFISILIFIIHLGLKNISNILKEEILK